MVPCGEPRSQPSNPTSAPVVSGDGLCTFDLTILTPAVHGVSNIECLLTGVDGGFVTGPRWLMELTGRIPTGKPRRDAYSFSPCLSRFRP